MWQVERLQFSMLLQIQVCLETATRAWFPALPLALMCTWVTGLCLQCGGEGRAGSGSSRGWKDKGEPGGKPSSSLHCFCQGWHLQHCWGTPHLSLDILNVICRSHLSKARLEEFVRIWGVVSTNVLLNPGGGENCSHLNQTYTERGWGLAKYLIIASDTSGWCGRQ